MPRVYSVSALNGTKYTTYATNVAHAEPVTPHIGINHTFNATAANVSNEINNKEYAKHFEKFRIFVAMLNVELITLAMPKKSTTPIPDT